MSLEILPIDAIAPEELMAAMENHQLVTVGMVVDPARIARMCDMAQFYLWHEDGEPVAVHLECHTDEPGVMSMFILIEDKTASKRLWNDIRALGTALRRRWFDDMGLRRVQCMVPESRVNIQRMLRAMGFVEETKRGTGLRGYFMFKNGKTESAQIWSLIESDGGSSERVEIAYEYAGD